MIITRNINVFYSKYIKLSTRWTSIGYSRTKSSAEPKTKTYSHTILFPKTKFPARSSQKDKNNIPEIAKFSELYKWQREQLTGPEYVLHDGPPYANGDLHMGHAVNKIIKDINNRSQVLQGNKVHYIPGWDCHGLPIEFKALQKAKTSNNNEPSDPVHTRQIARSFALETVEKQKEAFRSWGVMADWDEQCYLTLDKKYVQNQLKLFYKMYRDGLIYRALKPVYWSPSSRTALAEAELEYDPQFKSQEVYVAFPMVNLPDVVKESIGSKQVSALIWTTTPWTLLANKAIAYSPSMTYCVVTLSNRNGMFLIAKDQIEELEKVLETEVTVVVEFDGTKLQNSTYNSPLSNEVRPFYSADHVTKGKGTGLVHTAPAHGPEDFLVALKNNMTVECNVDETGCYTNLGPDFDGLPVLTEGQEVVMDKLANAIIHKGTYIHSYPLDWRTKKPVILRASHQWFIDTAALKERALAALDKVDFLPPSSADQSRQSFKAQLEKRPYWCISRQRAWGVPIPVLYKGNDVIVDEKVIEKLCTLIESKDADIWWTCDVKDVVPNEVLDKYNTDGQDVVKGKDIMDIWIDSGLSWQTLDGKKSRIYSEGIDQLTGWFQASLLTSIALSCEAPYESIFVHGFVVDEKKRKMSKSIGNVIDPVTIIHGDKNCPAYGIDTLRWWVACHATQHSQIIISKKLLDDCQSEIIRIRNIMKYLLGVVNDLKTEDFSKNPPLNFFDQYIVNECHTFLKQINEHYNNFRYNSGAQSILHFVSNKVSALYCHCIKDRLYCSEKDSAERLAAQLAIHTIMATLCKTLGPILPHLVEEAWQHHPLSNQPFYFTKELSLLPPKPIDVSLMDAILNLKRDVCIRMKNESLKKFDLIVQVNSDLYAKLNNLNMSDGVNDSVLFEILEVSNVELHETEKNVKNWNIMATVSKKGQCLRCRKFNVIGDSDKCVRCEKVLATL
ncbi:isoleucine--tRNA ligase, mitochondrial [Colias croceus]|uniref:isoleucine--tRNA ligase, mitochondrial n=1 Tax=Colias crocea TaxID=72248 RepID=UPI001E27C35F|nr:isoleucine--tRNA ligase, mitochondrial [Colias croceus]